MLCHVCTGSELKPWPCPAQSQRKTFTKRSGWSYSWWVWTGPWRQHAGCQTICPPGDSNIDVPVNKPVAGASAKVRVGHETAARSLEGQWSGGPGSETEGCLRKQGLCESQSGSDGSFHLPLSSRRTNYKVIDSGLITGATSGFKLAGWWCCACRDGERRGERGVQRDCVRACRECMYYRREEKEGCDSRVCTAPLHKTYMIFSKVSIKHNCKMTPVSYVL